MPWRDAWPGAAFVTVAAGLLWFYLLSLALLVGATINSLRHELHDTETAVRALWRGGGGSAAAFSAPAAPVSGHPDVS